MHRQAEGAQAGKVPAAVSSDATIGASAGSRIGRRTIGEPATEAPARPVAMMEGLTATRPAAPEASVGRSGAAQNGRGESSEPDSGSQTPGST